MLNNLLNGMNTSSLEWHPILPMRRHSMPSRPESDSNPFSNAESSSSALQTLLSNLRHVDEEKPSENASYSTEDGALLGELQQRVEALSERLPASDACLAQALVSLLSHVNQLSVLDPANFASRLPL